MSCCFLFYKYEKLEGLFPQNESHIGIQINPYRIKHHKAEMNRSHNLHYHPPLSRVTSLQRGIQHPDQGGKIMLLMNPFQDLLG